MSRKECCLRVKKQAAGDNNMNNRDWKSINNRLVRQYVVVIATFLCLLSDENTLSLGLCNTALHKQKRKIIKPVRYTIMLNAKEINAEKAKTNTKRT